MRCGTCRPGHCTHTCRAALTAIWISLSEPCCVFEGALFCSGPGMERQVPSPGSTGGILSKFKTITSSSLVSSLLNPSPRSSTHTSGFHPLPPGFDAGEAAGGGWSASSQPTPAEVLESLDEGYFVEVRKIPHGEGFVFNASRMGGSSSVPCAHATVRDDATHVHAYGRAWRVLHRRLRVERHPGCFFGNRG